MAERKWLTFGRIAYCYLEDGLVHKTYKPLEELGDLLPEDPTARAQIENVRTRGLAHEWTPAHRKFMFGMEVSKLAALTGDDGFPQLISADFRTLGLVMTYAGPDILEYDGPIPTYREMLPTLKSMYKRLRRSRVPYRDVHPANICWDGEKLRLVDFSWGGWEKVPEEKFLGRWKWSLKAENRDRQRRERKERIQSMIETGEDIVRALKYEGEDGEDDHKG